MTRHWLRFFLVPPREVAQAQLRHMLLPCRTWASMAFHTWSTRCLLRASSLPEMRTRIVQLGTFVFVNSMKHVSFFLVQEADMH